MTSFTIRFVSILVMLSAWCASSARAEPSIMERIEKALAYEIPAVWIVKRVDAEEPYNFGTASRPFFKVRFRAEIELRRDTFDLVSLDADASILRRVHPAGKTIEIFGICSARSDGDDWSLEFLMDGDPFAYSGTVRDAFSGPTFVEGSEEHAAHVSRTRAERAEREAWLRSRQAAERNAEAERDKAYAALSARLFSSLRSVVAGDMALQGAHVSRNGTSRQAPIIRSGFTISFFDYDDRSRTVKGTMTWTGGAEILVDGALSERSISLLETAWLKNPAHIDETFLRYDGELAPGAKIAGRVCANATRSGPCEETGDTFSIFLPESAVDLVRDRPRPRTDLTALATD